jgi:predicted negative regulator of RcsB-dependent stress response
MSRKELKQQDEVMTSLQRVYEWLRHYRLHLIVGALALIVVLLVASGVSSWLDSSSREVAVAFDKAFRPVTAAVTTSPEPDDAPEVALRPPAETFPTEEARAKAATERLGAFLAEHEGSSLASAARLGLASIEFDQGQYEQAQQKLSGFLADDDESPIAPYVLEHLGLAAAQQKKFEEAGQWLGRLAQSPSPYFQALGQLHVGDLANPRVPSAAAKDPAKAKAAYEQGLAALRKGERAVLPAERWLEDTLERKLALVDAAN